MNDGSKNIVLTAVAIVEDSMNDPPPITLLKENESGNYC
jgi:hypothetical protein